jgi:hypothetical protein
MSHNIKIIIYLMPSTNHEAVGYVIFSDTHATSCVWDPNFPVSTLFSDIPSGMTWLYKYC